MSSTCQGEVSGSGLVKVHLHAPSPQTSATCRPLPRPVALLLLEPGHRHLKEVGDYKLGHEDGGKLGPELLHGVFALGQGPDGALEVRGVEVVRLQQVPEERQEKQREEIVHELETEDLLDEAVVVDVLRLVILPVVEHDGHFAVQHVEDHDSECVQDAADLRAPGGPRLLVAEEGAGGAPVHEEREEGGDGHDEHEEEAVGADGILESPHLLDVPPLEAGRLLAQVVDELSAHPDLLLDVGHAPPVRQHTLLPLPEANAGERPQAEADGIQRQNCVVLALNLLVNEEEQAAKGRVAQPLGVESQEGEVEPDVISEVITDVIQRLLHAPVGIAEDVEAAEDSAPVEDVCPVLAQVEEVVAALAVLVVQREERDVNFACFKYIGERVVNNVLDQKLPLGLAEVRQPALAPALDQVPRLVGQPCSLRFLELLRVLVFTVRFVKEHGCPCGVERSINFGVLVWEVEIPCDVTPESHTFHHVHQFGFLLEFSLRSGDKQEHGNIGIIPILVWKKMLHYAESLVQ
mmetsp:Transcript_33050/g.75585  ORF Transcript_33050/g.75585 Transcript_33050/m.75585 type:complete len:520 (-) Transcript_33050:452-2011(-)